MSLKDDLDKDPNVIAIWDEQGELVETIHLDVCNQVADDVMSHMWDLEGELEHYDFSTTAFSVFIHCIHVLVDSGWSVEELTREVQDHGLMQSASQETLN